MLVDLKGLQVCDRYLQSIGPINRKGYDNGCNTGKEGTHCNPG